MGERNLRREEKFIKRRRFHARWRRVVMVLASIVVFCTTYALILPAITLEKGCTLEAHTHGETCFETQQVQTLACSAVPHSHTAGCYSEAGEVCCGYGDFLVHVHDESCYGPDSQLLCPLPQVREHTHGEGCYELRTHTHGPECYTRTQGAFICQREEAPAHTHGETCTGTLEICICPLEENHTHGDGCQDEEGNLICTQEEGHTHGVECYETTILECTLEETPDHTHNGDCWEWTEALACETPEEEWVLTCQHREAILHTHGDSCYDGDSLVCDKQEVQTHVHEDACFQETEQQVRICTLEEHTHDDTCQKPETTEYYCGKQPHTHTEECRDGEGNLICQLKEHTHLESCLEPPAPQYFCGKEEHTHAEGCFDEAGSLTCQLEEHTHGETCLEEAPSPYVCGKEAHTHGEGCCDESGAVICPLEAHTHGEDCLPKTYYCGREEHVHGETCFNEAGERVCGRTAHSHTDRCLLPIPYCGKEKHAHGDGCFDETGALTCQLEEHTHTPDCCRPTLLTEEELEALVAELTRKVEALESLDSLNEVDIAAAQELMERLEEAYRQRWLEEDVFTDLYTRVEALLLNAYDSIAEPCYGSNWILLRDSGWFYEYSGIATAYTLDGGSAVPYDALAEDKSESAQQVDDPGGSNENETDGVSVSKTLTGTDLENVFDITLTVQTPQNINEVIDEPDMAVVIVMDISNTMNDNFEGVTRYAAAVEAAEDFLDKFAASNSLGVSKIGYVAFNTNAHTIFGLQSCTNAIQANALKNTIRSQTGNIINNYEKNAMGEIIDHNRFTNIEGGLKLARDLLAGVSNKNKFIVFLSDGFPTTYVSSGYSGYDPYDPSGTYFYDSVLERPCTYGTSYSDTAAIQARKMAAGIKDRGITIFSIGVDVGGQTVQEYIDSSNSEHATKNKFSVVERSSDSYEIGDASSTESYKNWLKTSIGSGYYYDSTNTEGLKAAYDQIFEEIKQTIATSAAADWVASDPIPSITPGQIDFIGLYDKTNTLQGDSLAGRYAANAENTATYADSAITWDLKQSGYTVSETGGKEWYAYQLKYRIRLKNEDGAFVEDQIYKTNGETTLQYRVIETVNGTVTVSDQKTINFPIPSVHGYLGELEFVKKDNHGETLAGAEFTLGHADTCNICRGDGTRVEIADQVVTSGADGKVGFTGISSGHTYTLEETGFPPGYFSDGSQYTVTVAYDTVTVTVTDSGNNEKEWNGTIVNHTAYVLPNTGGPGTLLYTLGGLSLMLAAALLLHNQNKRRRGEP